MALIVKYRGRQGESFAFAHCGAIPAQRVELRDRWIFDDQEARRVPQALKIAAVALRERASPSK